jgi:hypothetical protein
MGDRGDESQRRHDEQPHRLADAHRFTPVMMASTIRQIGKVAA